jgi:2-keto-3-deoxy-galactonokinase
MTTTATRTGWTRVMVWRQHGGNVPVRFHVLVQRKGKRGVMKCGRSPVHDALKTAW